MSQPTKGKKSSKASRTHGDKNAGGASGDKKGPEAAERKPTSTGNAESPKTHTSGTPSISKTKSSSTASTKTPAMKPSETKAKAKAEAEKAAQLSKPSESQTKHPSEEKQKDPGGTQSPSKPSVVAEPKQPSSEKAALGQVDKPVKETSKKESKQVKSDDKALSTKAAVAAASTAGAVAAAGITAPSVESKENKSTVQRPDAASKESKPSEKSALDDLIDTLGSPEENEPPNPVYTGPQVLDPMSSLYIEELGKRESTIPPEYRKLLEGDGKVVPPPVAKGETQPTMTDDDLADALSSDFTCSAVPCAGEKKASSKEKPAGDGDLVQAQSTNLISSSAPPKEKKPKLEDVEISGSALDALVDTLGMPEPEPEIDLSSIVEVEEPKAKEKKEKRTGEWDDTIPPEYRLKPALDKDGKPLLPEPEEKTKPVSDSDLADELSKDFACPAPPAEKSEPPKSTDMSKKPAAAETPEVPKERVDSSVAVPPVQPLAASAVSAKPAAAETPKVPKERVDSSVAVPPVQPLAASAVSAPSPSESQKPAKEEVISTASVPSVQSSAPLATSPSTHVPDDVLEALSGSLGGKEPELKEKKPAVDKVKEKAKQTETEKLGEDEETIPPDYRLTEAKDKDGKPLLPKPEEKSQPMSDSELLDALSEGFSCASVPVSKAAPQELAASGKSPTEEVFSSAVASAVHSSVPPTTTPAGKELDAAADLLADSLGQREPDPDENKPVVDKVKEKAKSEHRDKLGERDDTIPPDYRHLLDSDEKGKPIKPTAKDGEKPKEQKKPADDSTAIDALSGDFDNCGKPPVSQQLPRKDEKVKDTATSKSVTKDEKKPKASKKAKEQSSSAKSEKQKKS